MSVFCILPYFSEKKRPTFADGCMPAIEDILPRIYLTGFMGSGKSTVGQILANVLGYRFIDLDEEIARREGLSVGELFKVRGEAYFREQERRVLAETFAMEQVVVATGGGTLAHPENMRRALEQGTVVYLMLEEEDLLYRLKRIRNRPLLLDEEGEPLPPEALRRRVVTLLQEREPVYRQAHVHVPVGNVPVGLTVDAVVSALRIYARQKVTSVLSVGKSDGDRE